MLLLGALFVLFAGGFWLYCLADVALTPSDECPRLPKAAWVAVVAGTFVIGASVWLAVRQPAQRAGGRPAQLAGGRPGKGKPAREEPVRPASPAVSAVGPDDDPEFLHSLNRAAR
jgi:hypothetical protein